MDNISAAATSFTRAQAIRFARAPIILIIAHSLLSLFLSLSLSLCSSRFFFPAGTFEYVIGE